MATEQQELLRGQVALCRADPGPSLPTALGLQSAENGTDSFLAPWNSLSSAGKQAVSEGTACRAEEGG